MHIIQECNRLALAAILAGLIPAWLLAAGFGTLNGKVTDAKTGKPVAGATVKIQIGKGMAAQTNKDGYYLFSNIVPTGIVNIAVSKDGYVSKTVSKISITTGVKNLNASLSHKAPPSPAPSGTSSQKSPPPPASASTPSAPTPSPQPGHTATPKPAQPKP